MKKILAALTMTLLTACSGTGTDGAGQPRLQPVNEALSLLDTSTNSRLLGLNFGLTLSANLVPPPTQDGYNLQANNIYVNGLDSFVTYNYSGDTKKGAIDHILTTVATLPVLTSELKSSTGEFNGLFKSGSTLYSVGATDDTVAGGPAVLQSIPLTLGVLNTASQTNMVTTTLRSFAGTGVVGKASSLYAVSGDGSGAEMGGLAVYSGSTLLANTDIPDARAVDFTTLGTNAAKTDNVYVLSGKSTIVNSSNVVTTTNSKIYRISDSGAILSSIDLGASANTIRESKSTIQVGRTMILASKGDGGFGVYCAADGATLASVPAVLLPGVSAEATVTNSVTAGPGLVFAANGQAGVYVYEFKKTSSTASACQGVSLNLLGSIDLGTSPVTGVGPSANHVQYAGLGILGATSGTLYVASGVSGFKIINLVQAANSADVYDFQ